MNPSVYLRPLKIEDAEISYKWRNQPHIWSYTKYIPDKEITVETETNWLAGILTRHDEKRFAICLKEEDRYVGNTQLLNIAGGTACFHIFIGESDLWGKGIAKAATYLLMQYAFRTINLEKVSLEVNAANLPGIAVYAKIGFLPVGQDNEFINMELTKQRFEEVFMNEEVL
ncbi:GNAT family protein [Pedobacter sp. P351]|uniref:GNAT family N-acetyltransferase n=1 Tax=Pedobacter superstes TaxID=3133441 RepID=UPI003099BABF